MKDYQYLQQRYVVNTYVNRRLTLIKGEGVFLFNDRGKKFLDLMTNYGVNIFGYNHPVITKVLIKQLEQLTTLHGSFANDKRAEAAEALIKKCNGIYDQVYWSNSGAEAIEAALKFAVLATGKRRFVVAEHGYHGKTLGALSATSGEKYKKPFEPLLWEFVSIPFNNIETLEQVLTSDTAAFIVEPIQGEGGIFVPNSDYLQQVKEICSQHNTLLIIDEIQTGNGRTGTFLASEGISADILCLGKGLAGGIPVGAIIVTKEVAHAIPKHIHSSTFGGNPLACRGILTVLELLNDNQLRHIEEIGKYFIQQLSSLKSSQITAVRGKGLMIGLEVHKEVRNNILKMLQDAYVLAIPAGENVVRFLPPFIIEKDHIDLTVEILDRVLNKLSHV